MTPTVEDNSEGERVVGALLEGAGFSGFSFSTQFSLRFTRPSPGRYEGQELPSEVELVLHGTWRFGNEVDWEAHVSRLSPAGAVEPDEPVQALELAALRWTDGARVESASVFDGTLTLRFVNGRVLTASGALDDGETAWVVAVAGESEIDATWSVVSEEGRLFVRRPNLGP